MFSSLPVTLAEKVSTERQLQQLAERVGVTRLRQCEVILPNQQFFPEPFAATEAWAEMALARIATWLQADPARARLAVVDAPHEVVESISSSPWLIVCERRHLSDPRILLASLARQLARQLLLEHAPPGREFSTGSALEPIGDAHRNSAPDATVHRTVDSAQSGSADLFPILHGLGVIMANGVLEVESRQALDLHHFEIHRHGTLPSRVLGYALACFAWARQEFAPAWLAQVQPDPRAAARAGLKRLRRSNDCLFQPFGQLRQNSPARIEDNVQAFRGSSPSARLLRMWQIQEENWLSARGAQAVATCLRERDRDLRAAACQALGAAEQLEPEIVDQLVRHVSDSSHLVRIAACHALGRHLPDLDRARSALEQALADSDPAVVREAAGALAGYGRTAEAAGVSLVQALRRSIVRCHVETAAAVGRALRVVVPAPEDLVQEVLGPHDIEFLAQVREQLVE